jgi:transcriptional regulator with XRE-family HTH domain
MMDIAHDTAECRVDALDGKGNSSSRIERMHSTLPGMDIPILSQSDFQSDAGLRLRQLIAKLGMTQVEAARIMGISKNVLRNWLAGDHPIAPYPLYRLCKAKNIDFNYVFLGDWSHLPYGLAKEFEREIATKLADVSEGARPRRAKQKT